MRGRLFTDGGARGNPGPAASAFVLEAEDGTVLDARGESIGVATNNVAEYRALLAGLRRALELGVDDLEVVSDSELLVKQMRGEYRVKNEALRRLSAGGGDSRTRDRGGRLHRTCGASTTSSPTGSSTRPWTAPDRGSLPRKAQSAMVAGVIGKRLIPSQSRLALALLLPR